MSRALAGGLALVLVAALVLLGLSAPEHLSEPDLSRALATPGDFPPFGADMRGRPLWEYAAQGARVVTVPALVGGLIVLALGVVGGLLACVASGRVQAAVQGAAEVIGALPRMVVVLVVALLLPADARGLMPIAVTWALLSAPGAMDEAASVASRLGGARFVEALRAHGFSRWRIFLYHVVALNLRPVVVRQGVEVMAQVVFLEIGLSYLAVSDSQPSFTHGDATRSWADILDLGYKSALGLPTGHALALGLGLMAMISLTTVFVSQAVRAR